MKEVLPGQIWRHYKGGVYRILHMARHTETEEPMVVYQPVEGGTVWCRPLAMFGENVGTADYNGPRFVLEQDG